MWYVWLWLLSFWSFNLMKNTEVIQNKSIPLNEIFKTMKIDALSKNFKHIMTEIAQCKRFCNYIRVNTRVRTLTRSLIAKHKLTLDVIFRSL